jgi:acetyl-CoA carboxylase carboxyltransferase component
VLATVKRDGIEARGGTWSASEERDFKAPLLEQYEHQGHPYYASARLWDDGVIDPAETRRVLGLSLAATLERADSADEVRRVPDVTAIRDVAFVSYADMGGRAVCSAPCPPGQG